MNNQRVAEFTACINEILSQVSKVRIKRKAERILQGLSAMLELPDELAIPKLQRYVDELCPLLSELDGMDHFIATLERMVSREEGEKTRDAHSFDAAQTKQQARELPTLCIDRSSSTAQKLTEQMHARIEAENFTLCQRHFLELNQKLKNRPPIFFGSAFGQRLLRQAFHYFLDAAFPNYADFKKAITESHVEKTRWPDVANYFLLGLAKQVHDQVGCADSWDKSNGLEKPFFWQGVHRLLLQQGKSIHDDIYRTDYRHKPDYRYSQPTSDAIQRIDLLNRRACKYLMMMACDLGRPILYALDEIDLKIAASGGFVEVQNKSDVKRKVPVVSTELRFLFRHWDAFADAVLFYKNLKVMTAPWVGDQMGGSYWAAYALHLMRKHLIQYGRVSSLVATTKLMLSLYSKCDFDRVIAHYHASKPTKHYATLFFDSMREKPTAVEYDDSSISLIKEIECALSDERGHDASQFKAACLS